MPGENIMDWSTTAVSNASADSSINWAEGQSRASVNDSARSMMAAHAKDRNLWNGSIITTGSANAQAFTSGLGYSSVPTGLRVLLKLGFTNTGSATLNMDSIGAVTIKNQVGSNLSGGELAANGYVDLLYNGTNWILLTNPSYTTGTFTPELRFGGTFNGTYSVDNGIYTKIGRTVFFSLQIVLSSKGSTSGNAMIQGLPFTTAATYEYTFSPFYSQAALVSDGNDNWVHLPAGDTALYLYFASLTAGGAVVHATDANFQNSTGIIVTGHYET